MKAALAPGVSGEVSLVVEAPAMTIDIPGAGPVYSTPRMIWDLEVAAMDAIRPHLDPGEASVGAAVEVRHLAATPAGMRVTARVRVTAVQGRMVTFALEAFDEKEKIGEGKHQRFVVDTARFRARLATKHGRGA